MISVYLLLDCMNIVIFPTRDASPPLEVAFGGSTSLLALMSAKLVVSAFGENNLWTEVLGFGRLHLGI